MCHISSETIERAMERMRERENGVRPHYSERVISVKHEDGFTIHVRCKSGNVISHRYTYHEINEAFGRAWVKNAKTV